MNKPNKKPVKPVQKSASDVTAVPGASRVKPTAVLEHTE